MYFLIGAVIFGCTSEKSTTENSLPEAMISSHSDGDEILEGETIIFSGSVSDGNHEATELSVSWYADSELICVSSSPEPNGSTQCEAGLETGVGTISLEVQDPEGGRAEATISIEVIESEIPTAQIISPLGSGRYYSDQLISFEGLISDEEDDAEDLTVYWVSSLDGELTEVEANPNSSGEIFGVGNLSLGEHAIELYVEDSTGKTDSESVIINVGPPNSAPLCEILTPLTGSAGTEGDEVLFTALVSDADISADQLSVIWSSDKDGDIGSSTATSAGDIVFSYSDLSINTHTISITVADEVGATCSTVITYTVGTPPSVVIQSPVQGDIYSEGDALDFIAMVSDAQDSPEEVSLDWVLNGVSVSAQSAEPSGTAQYTDDTLAYGVYDLVVTATDTDGLSNSAQLSFTINGIPSAPLISISPDPVYTTDGLTINIDTDSIDPEGVAPTYTYEWMLNGAIQPAYTASALPSTATSKGEEWMARVIPSDGIITGDAGEATIIIQNTPPGLSGLAISPSGTAYNDDVLTCSGAVTDPDETPILSYEWSLEGNIIGSSASLDLSNTGAMPADSLTCTIIATDGDGEEAVDSVSVVIGNRGPSLMNTVISPNTNITTSTLLTCSATASDDDGESLTPSYSWMIGGSSYTGASLQLDPSMVSPSDLISCAADVVDGSGEAASDTASVTVQNTLPTITASISANGTTNTGELTCSAIAEDADDSVAPLISYEWFNSSGSLGTVNPLQLDSGMGLDGDTIDCIATATDLSGGVVSDTASHVITNSLPVIDTIELLPSTVTVNTASITCSTTVSDSDGDTVVQSFEWYAGTQLQSETTSTFTGPFDVGAEIICQVTPNDGKENGNMIEISVTVDNTPPVIDSIALSPDPASESVYTNDTITITAVLSDDDSSQQGNLTAIYDWYVDNSLSPVQSGTDNTLSGSSYFDKDQEVYVVVTPNDGVENGNSVSSSTIIISNSRPEISALTLTPDPAIAGQDDLSCEVTATDADGDNIVYTYEWTNSLGLQQTTSEVSSTSDSFLAGGLHEDNWTCTVTPFDDDEYGDSASESVTVESGCWSLEFDGIDDFIGFANYQLTDSDFTIEAWVYDEELDPASNSGIIEFDRILALSRYHTSGTDRDGYLTMQHIGEYNVTSDDAYVSHQHWHHIAVTHIANLGYTTQAFRFYVDGVEDFSRWDGGLFPGFPQGNTGSIGRSSAFLDNGYSYFHGKINSIRISSNIRYSSDFIPSSFEADSDTAVLWKLNEGQGSIAIDSAGNSNGTITGASWVNFCPEEDLDGDGVASWEDCDDSDPLAWAVGSGASASCAAESCKTIIDDGHVQIGDNDIYWIDPAGTGAFEVYCDMTTDNGGWTLVMNLNTISATDYDSADILETKSAIGSLSDDNYLSPAFYYVPFTESYLWNETDSLPVYSEVSFAAGTLSDVIDTMNAGSYVYEWIWGYGAQGQIIIRNTSTSDGYFSNGDLRLMLKMYEEDGPGIRHTVSELRMMPDYPEGASFLVLDSDYGYAGGRIWGQSFTDIATCGIDRKFMFYVR